MKKLGHVFPTVLLKWRLSCFKQERLGVTLSLWRKNIQNIYKKCTKKFLKICSFLLSTVKMMKEIQTVSHRFLESKVRLLFFPWCISVYIRGRGGTWAVGTLGLPGLDHDAGRRTFPPLSPNAKHLFEQSLNLHGARLRVWRWMQDQTHPVICEYRKGTKAAGKGGRGNLTPHPQGPWASEAWCGMVATASRSSQAGCPPANFHGTKWGHRLGWVQQVSNLQVNGQLLLPFVVPILEPDLHLQLGKLIWSLSFWVPPHCMHPGWTAPPPYTTDYTL